MFRLIPITAGLASLAFALPASAAVVVGDSGDNNLHGTSHADTIYGKGGSDSINSRAGNDQDFGGPGNDFILDGGGNDVVKGGGGRDNFNVNRGADAVFGGRGNDQILVYHDGSADVINCGQGRHDRATYVGNREKHDTYIRCERVVAYYP